jgi:hypothetical protein
MSRRSRAYAVFCLLTVSGAYFENIELPFRRRGRRDIAINIRGQVAGGRYYHRQQNRSDGRDITISAICL